MMNRKIEKTFTYYGLGFPIILKQVPMIEVRGIWTPDIDLNLLQKVVLLCLAHLRSDLTGNQIRFIRKWLRLNQCEFGKLLGVTHVAVVKWEKNGDNAAKMMLTTQRSLRMLILDRLLGKDAEFRQAFRLLNEIEFIDKPETITINTPVDLVAI